jgi:hypothetical protein
VVRASTNEEYCVAKRRRYTKRIGTKMWESRLRKGSLLLAVLAILPRASLRFRDPSPPRADRGTDGE